MEKVPIEIVIPIFNEGKKVLKLLDLFQSNIKNKIRVLLCYDLDTDNIFEYKSVLKDYKFNVTLVKNPTTGPCAAIKKGLYFGNSDCVIVYPADDLLNIDIVLAPSCCNAKIIDFAVPPAPNTIMSLL